MKYFEGKVKEAGLEIIDREGEGKLARYLVAYECCRRTDTFTHQSIRNRIRRIRERKSKKHCRWCAQKIRDSRYRRRLEAQREVEREQAKLSQEFMGIKPPGSVLTEIKTRRGGSTQ